MRWKKLVIGIGAGVIAPIIVPITAITDLTTVTLATRTTIGRITARGGDAALALGFGSRLSQRLL